MMKIRKILYVLSIVAALALLWLKTLSGVVSPFSPVGADAEIMAKIRACVAEMPEA